MTYTQLEYIISVNKHRHFQKAANSCHVTQPTLSMQIAKLEEELNLIIFDRSKSPLVPTMAGIEIIKQAKLAILEYKKIFTLANLKRDAVEGEFKLAVIPTISPYLIPIFLNEFTKKYPDINLTILERSTCDIITMLQNDEIDAAIYATPTKEKNFIERVLYYEPFRIILSPNHSLLSKKSIKQSDLHGSDLWLLNEGHCFRNQTLKICHKSHSTHCGPKNIEFESGSIETLKNLVLKGHGHTLLPYLATLDLPQNQKDLIRPFVLPEPSREISLVHSRNFLKEGIIDALQNFILDQIPKELKSLKNRKIEIIKTCNS